MTKLGAMTDEEQFEYVNQHPEEFEVVKVRGNLVSLVDGEDFEKLLVQSLPKLTTQPVADVKTAAKMLQFMGFNLHINAINDSGRIVDAVETEVPMPIWIRFVMESIAPLFNGEIDWYIRHIETNEVLPNHHAPEDLQWVRDGLGLDRNRSLSEQLPKLFEQIEAGRNQEPYDPASYKG